MNTKVLQLAFILAAFVLYAAAVFLSKRRRRTAVTASVWHLCPYCQEPQPGARIKLCDACDYVLNLDGSSRARLLMRFERQFAQGPSRGNR
ncbi:MAG TPA: hypothetical protein VN622_08965 [Clostridia bacterium]|nr:hypothetical protein [Clostridia bacterium]